MKLRLWLRGVKEWRPFWYWYYKWGKKTGFDDGWDKGWDACHAAYGKWDFFNSAELDELSISLEHRLEEAKKGNEYVYVNIVTALLEDLYLTHPELKIETSTD